MVGYNTGNASINRFPQKRPRFKMMIYLSIINLFYEQSIQYSNGTICRHAVVF
jgi:hypothetical protein